MTYIKSIIGNDFDCFLVYVEIIHNLFCALLCTIHYSHFPINQQQQKIEVIPILSSTHINNQAHSLLVYHNCHGTGLLSYSLF